MKNSVDLLHEAYAEILLIRLIYSWVASYGMGCFQTTRVAYIRKKGIWRIQMICLSVNKSVTVIIYKHQIKSTYDPYSPSCISMFGVSKAAIDEKLYGTDNCFCRIGGRYSAYNIIRLTMIKF